MMNQFGPIISVRVVACTDSSDLVVVVEFQDIESAIRCKAKMNYQELVPGLSCIVSFAKIIFVEDTKQQQQLPQQRQENLMLQLDTPTPSSQLSGHHRDQSRGTEGGIANTSSISPSRHIDEQPKDTSFNEEYDRFERICKDLLADKVSLSGPQLSHLSILIHRALRYNSVRGYGLGKLPEPLAVRKFDTPRLRDIRKQLDSNQLPRINVEELALAMYVELPELASDYLGNTIVQKLLEICSSPIRDVMIKHLLPYLAQMGAHKNGTWAAQKMINTVSTEREKWLISRALYKYFTQLFNDQYANYVVHGVLKFGGPYNDFIVEAMLATFMEIARNRFGARAIRTCLESDSISKEASVAISTCVLTWCWDLMVDPNGSLLVTWFLDTCTVLPDRHCLLAKTLCEDDATDSSSITTSSVSQEVRELGLNLDDPTLAMGVNSRLCKVCCSKLGHLSVLKVLNYRTDLTARDMILRRIFGDSVFECDEADLDANFVEPPYLVRILTESSSNGPAFIYKVLSIPTLDPELRARIVHLVRTVLQDHNLIGSHQHKRLCEEVGLKVSTRSRALSSVSTGRRRRSRSRSSSTNTLLGGAPVSGTVDGSPTIGGHRHSRYSPPLSSQQTCGFSYDSATASNGTNSSTNKNSHTPNVNASSAAVTGEFNGNNISPQFDYDMMLGSQFEKLSLNGGFTPRQFYHDRQQSQNSNRNGQSPGQQLFY
ncbi:DEKNAAC100122 [Brettanomyces naardenensis]|uniref:DEKNAAC100122 n=1 Tax=Brettanomyces naardenensis TaxID=13370 RepID=A0A448YFI1_BRENA|nr:DEKNAAC100122 [Brettanomyces naardenensis]